MKVAALIMLRERYGLDLALPNGYYRPGGAIFSHIFCGDPSVSIWSCVPGRPSEQLESEYSQFWDGYGNEHFRTDAASLGI